MLVCSFVIVIFELNIIAWLFPCRDDVVFSFHVGSGCYDASAYSAAVISAKEVFDMGEMAGFHFDLLDIGGGFPGYASAKPSFEEARHLLFSQ